MTRKKIYSMLGVVQVSLALLLATCGYSPSFVHAHDIVSVSGDSDTSQELWINHPYYGKSEHRSGLPQYPPAEEDGDDDKTEEDTVESDACEHSSFEIHVLHIRLSLRLSTFRLIFMEYQASVPLYVLFHSWKNFLI
ncbi:hypothetical protein JMN32_15570 [Fulvivirga sp. 29W222]|uniref:DUF4198 domain-containing protein n=1 Tax=Fulvivirga marina TaxID=2494733 RepID=A0A937KCP2_9BACT|nr:hypothetical protein [Fulvivirga marina]MBL6447737.1 hypothetical protein [Fulvivirga marina]